MKTANSSPVTSQEEQKRFGAKPRVKAVIQGAGLAVPIEIDEDQIIDCGNLIASRPAYFHDIHGETHILTLDNRGHQWQPGHANFLIPDGIWYGREIHIYTGFDVPGAALNGFCSMWGGSGTSGISAIPSPANTRPRYFPAS